MAVEALDPRKVTAAIAAAAAAGAALMAGFIALGHRAEQREEAERTRFRWTDKNRWE